MVELEVQTLSLGREGLLIDVGRSVTESGFTLQRQRMVQDPNGVLLTMIVRGPARQQRALEAALDAQERVISFDISAYVEGEKKPHFAASREPVSRPAAPMPKPAIEAAPAAVHATSAAPVATVASIAAVASVAAVATAASEASAEPPATDISASIPAFIPPVDEPAAVEAASASTVADRPEPVQESEFELFLASPPKSEPAPVPAPEPFVEITPLAPDIPAVEKVLSGLATDYPQIVPQLLTLEQSVAEGARESSLALAGQRTGTWVFERDHMIGTSKFDLHGAIAHIGAPALGELVEVEHEGEQLRIRNSPLCSEDGHSGCSFFSGFLEGLLGPVMLSDSLSIFAVCCRSYGADACVLALSD